MWCDVDASLRLCLLAVCCRYSTATLCVGVYFQVITLCCSSGRIVLEEREKAERQTNTETLCNSEGKVCVCVYDLCGSLWSWPSGLKDREVWTRFLPTVSALQEELATAQTRLQELQDDLTSAKQLHKALEDTQSQLRDRDAEIALIKTGFLMFVRCAYFY